MFISLFSDLWLEIFAFHFRPVLEAHWHWTRLPHCVLSSGVWTSSALLSFRSQKLSKTYSWDYLRPLCLKRTILHIKQRDLCEPSRNMWEKTWNQVTRTKIFGTTSAFLFEKMNAATDTRQVRENDTFRVEFFSILATQIPENAPTQVLDKNNWAKFLGLHGSLVSGTATAKIYTSAEGKKFQHNGINFSSRQSRNADSWQRTISQVVAAYCLSLDVIWVSKRSLRLIASCLRFSENIHWYSPFSGWIALELADSNGFASNLISMISSQWVLMWDGLCDETGLRCVSFSGENCFSVWCLSQFLMLVFQVCSHKKRFLPAESFTSFSSCQGFSHFTLSWNTKNIIKCLHFVNGSWGGSHWLVIFHAEKRE